MEWPSRDAVRASREGTKATSAFITIDLLFVCLDNVSEEEMAVMQGGALWFLSLIAEYNVLQFCVLNYFLYFNV